MKKKLKIKICGMREFSNISSISMLKPDFMGFIFYRNSPRFVGENFIAPNLGKISKVGVFVNASEEEILRKSFENRIKKVQLHGDESPNFCEKISRKGLKIIKAFQIKDSFSFEKVKAYTDICPYFLFDTNTPNFGGSGKKFLWSKLSEYKEPTPFFLSGGISADDCSPILSISHSKLFCIDMNSRFEEKPAIKNKILFKSFIKKIRK
ncbi:MAG TPA: phosphoribosylanthranilate isomerase [Candidatus Angelobacter sp.]|jgi:phosphoribosylanthranilate isomerase|nr:phosphoribosylanthranilate isomerase [Candidatus Angelobacter sp.]